MSLDFYLTEIKPTTVFSSNITHNLNAMAEEAGIYGCLWRPEEHGIIQAKQMIAPLEKALYDMRARRGYYEQFNAKNGWGTYEHFVSWVEGVLNACKENPDATVSVSR